MIYPSKLKPGDTIRVVALSGPIEWAKPEKLKNAEKFFKARGVNVTYGKRMQAADGPLMVVSIEDRTKDLEEALTDPLVRAVWILLGGYNSNQLLPHLDTKLFKQAKKILVGHSDNAVLLNALTSKTGVVTYYGPNFHAIGSSKGSRTAHEFIDRCIFSDFSYDLEPVKTWHDKDYSIQPPRSHSYREHEGWWSIQAANGAGELIGGEISTITLLHGSSFAPSLKGKILALEMFQGNIREFDRLLESILLQRGADKLEGLIIGRFQKSAQISKDDLKQLLMSKEILHSKPIIANVDFGHTTPRLTLPIGGHVQLQASTQKQRIRIGEH